MAPGVRSPRSRHEGLLVAWSLACRVHDDGFAPSGGQRDHQPLMLGKRGLRDGHRVAGKSEVGAQCRRYGLAAACRWDRFGGVDAAEVVECQAS